MGDGVPSRWSWDPQMWASPPSPEYFSTMQSGNEKFWIVFFTVRKIGGFKRSLAAKLVPYPFSLWNKVSLSQIRIHYRTYFFMPDPDPDSWQFKTKHKKILYKLCILLIKTVLKYRLSCNLQNASGFKRTPSILQWNLFSNFHKFFVGWDVDLCMWTWTWGKAVLQFPAPLVSSLRTCPSKWTIKRHQNRDKSFFLLTKSSKHKSSNFFLFFGDHLAFLDPDRCADPLI